VDDKTIQAILRHCNVAITQNAYIKTVPADSIAAMQQLENAISFSDRSQPGKEIGAMPSKVVN